jgi:hypothetical protein
MNRIEGKGAIVLSHSQDHILANRNELGVWHRNFHTIAQAHPERLEPPA